MNYAYIEEDEMDLNQPDAAYDGSEYQLDEFGEQIVTSTDDLMSGDGATDTRASEDLAEDEATTPETKIEDGFGEIINPDNSEHLTDQIDDDNLSTEAQSDIDADKATEPDSDRPIATP